MFKLRTQLFPWALLLTILAAVTLAACGPSAHYQESLDNGNAPTSRVATQADDTPGPTGTPEIYPTKPPFPPTFTPYPTLEPDPPGAAEEQPPVDRRAATPVLSLEDEVTQFTRERKDTRYNAIIRAEVTAHRLVEPNLDITWPDEIGNPPYYEELNGDGYASWRRSKLDITATYYGSLPQGYELLAPSFFPNDALDIGNEYILFITQAYVSEDEFPGRGKHHLNEEQLTAFGGKAGYVLSSHAWIIDGDTAWKLPLEHIGGADTPDLPVAKATGDSLSVTDLVSAINTGLGK